MCVTSSEDGRMAENEHPIAWYKKELEKLRDICEQLRYENKRKDALIEVLSTSCSNNGVEELASLARRREEALAKYKQEYESRPDYRPPSLYETDSANQMYDGEGFDEIDSMPETFPTEKSK